MFLHRHRDLCDHAMSLSSADGCRINIKLGDVRHFLAHCYSALLVDCSHPRGCPTSLRALFWLLKLCVCLLPHCRTKIPLGGVRHFLARCYSALLVACSHPHGCPTSLRLPFRSYLCRRCKPLRDRASASVGLHLLLLLNSMAPALVIGLACLPFVLAFFAVVMLGCRSVCLLHSVLFPPPPCLTLSRRQRRDHQKQQRQLPRWQLRELHQQTAHHAKNWKSI